MAGAMALADAATGDEQAQTIAGLLAIIADLSFELTRTGSGSHDARKALDAGVAYRTHQQVADER